MAHEARNSLAEGGGGFLYRVFRVRRGELPAVVLAASFNFCLLAAYYVLRPLRDEIGSQHKDALAHVYTITFFVMLAAAPVYAWLVVRWPRRVFIPVVYGFFISNILAFSALLRWHHVLDVLQTLSPLHWAPDGHLAWIEISFYVWTSVFNLFAVTVFWGFMADLFTSGQGKRLYGPIAVGGSLGATLGPLLTARQVDEMGRANLLIVAATLLAVAAIIALLLDRLRRGATAHVDTAKTPPAPAEPVEKPRKRGVLTGIIGALGAVFASPYLLIICGYLLLYSLGSTFLYMEQAELANAAIEDRGERAAFFAYLDSATNGLTLLVQLVLLAHIIRKIGVGVTLMFVPILTTIAFGVLGAMFLLRPSLVEHGLIDAKTPLLLGTIAAITVLRRASNFAFSKPTRETLFTVIQRDQKYASKGFIDTVVYRGSDVANAWLFRGFLALGFSLGGIVLAAAPLVACGAIFGLLLGRRQTALAAASEAPCKPSSG